jgi:hypothetical protein
MAVHLGNPCQQTGNSHTIEYVQNFSARLAAAESEESFLMKSWGESHILEDPLVSSI